MKCGSFGNKLNIFLILTSIVMIYVTYQSSMDAYGQSMTAMNNTVEQHAEHTLDNLIISEHIPLTGQLAGGDYILLMDFTPFVTSIEGHSHIALKVPCNEEGNPRVTIVTGIAPSLNTLNFGNAIYNGQQWHS